MRIYGVCKSTTNDSSEPSETTRQKMGVLFSCTYLLKSWLHTYLVTYLGSLIKFEFTTAMLPCLELYIHYELSDLNNTQQIMYRKIFLFLIIFKMNLFLDRLNTQKSHIRASKIYSFDSLCNIITFKNSIGSIY